MLRRSKLRDYVYYTTGGTIASPFIRRHSGTPPKVKGFIIKPLAELIALGRSNGKNLRAFVRLIKGKYGNSIVIMSGHPGKGMYKEIPYDICCFPEPIIEEEEEEDDTEPTPEP